ncbi:hypothetical protein [Arthrobacter sp. L77]|uniref:hypothetical protein n=1 Tax=Arthrobacter sp. L77 TaxID=1496689 RepID=UPI00068CDA6F|nr:hypothetical protein [Arthrobacter sp. L77]
MRLAHRGLDELAVPGDQGRRRDLTAESLRRPADDRIEPLLGRRVEEVQLFQRREAPAFRRLRVEDGGTGCAQEPDRVRDRAVGRTAYWKCNLTGP